MEQDLINSHKTDKQTDKLQNNSKDSPQGDLISSKSSSKNIKASVEYNASAVEVLEGLEAVRKRPGMYIGGKDENAMHHLVTEILDNSMDEAVAGYADLIEIIVHQNGSITIADNGRGIPVDPHPKMPDKSALEIILTTLHSGSKFSDKIYATSAGLHGVGLSVVNALSESLTVEVTRNKILYKQNYSRGYAISEIEKLSRSPYAQGTRITFIPDKEIFGDKAELSPKRIYKLAKSKAYLFKGIKISWKTEIIIEGIPEEELLCFPEGLQDFIIDEMDGQPEEALREIKIFAGTITAEKIKIDWAVGWGNPFLYSFCNTIPTPLGGTHEQGFRQGLFKAIKNYAEMASVKKKDIIVEDLLSFSSAAFSIFIGDPLFQGQTKEKLVSEGVNKQVEAIIREQFEQWLISNKQDADAILNHVITIAEIRLSRKSEKSNIRNSLVNKRYILPDKLADCSIAEAKGTELFIVEGDAAGGSAKKARNRANQAILPIQGKILNVASNSFEKSMQNQEIKDLEYALACGTLSNYNEDKLRYEKIIIMTDADVDGAHIATLLMTFFFLRMPQIIQQGHLYLAKPPLFKLSQSARTYYALNEVQREELIKKLMKQSKAKIEVSRFKGLGEMSAQQLKETTMDPNTRVLIKVEIKDIDEIHKVVDDLMGKNPEKRFNFIQRNALNKATLENLDL